MLGHKVLFKYDEKFVVEMLNLLIHEVSSLSAVHVCGVVTPLVKKVLLQTDVDMVDHEFAGTPRNVHAYSRDDFERTGKLLAYGCVSSVSPQVETPQEISESITTALSIFGPRIVVKPDCGFAGMKGVPEAYRIAIMKLKNMVQAARTVASAKS
jgi:methionine synthase II (cobalamin-independent)